MGISALGFRDEIGFDGEDDFGWCSQSLLSQHNRSRRLPDGRHTLPLLFAEPPRCPNPGFEKLVEARAVIQDLLMSSVEIV